ncbi:cation transporter [Salinisphaera sp. USBA-960]|uniref:cation diffusion facilitator family transporter n=1 Tax=Salinisphaera orenii TaxID=856731 RepID=UPI000DBE0838|nr:cation transporter [Salifodinibacter halophilus]NNC25526.1 cation transporter [Salifodinibacter halophilus]
MSATEPAAGVGDKTRVTLLGAILNLPLAAIKILAGIFGHSQALLADGIHSAADLIGDALVFTSVRVASRNADADHPYGHARIETAATGGVALFLLITAGSLAYGGGLDVIRGDASGAAPTVLALAVALASLAFKEALFWYTLAIARRTQSPLLRANAWHHRSDALSSIAAIAGIIGSMLGVPIGDGLATIAIALMLAIIGARYGWQSFRELTDAGLTPDRVRAVRERIMAVPGVYRMRRLRTRVMGGHDAFADVGVLVDPYLSLTEAHRISERISAELIGAIDEIADVCVHIEPDGQADKPAAHGLPLREEILPTLRTRWAVVDIAQRIERVVLHYVEDAIWVDLVLPLELASEDATHQAAFDRALADLTTVAGVRLYYVRCARAMHGA